MKKVWKRAAAFAAAAAVAATLALPVSADWEAQEDGAWKYVENGEAVGEGWKAIGGQWYNFDSNGTMRTGWFEDSGQRYYLRADGVMARGWQQVDGAWYRFGGDGTPQGGWAELDGGRYFTDAAGKMQTGVIEVDGVVYLLDAEGVLQQGTPAEPAAAFFRSDGSRDDAATFRWDGSVVTVTTFEHYTVPRIAAALDAAGVCSEADFLAAVNREQPFAYNDAVPSDVCYRYEGYLYPDTYEFYRGESADRVVALMLKNFERKVTVELKDELWAAGWTLHDAMSMASIIQAEASKKSEMEAVSAIFQNRLDNPEEYPKLQSNPTSSYAKKVVLPATGNEALADLYDSYKSPGLIAGPINNPGLQAINALLNPSADAAGSYFFCTDKAGNFYFASTYQQHLDNCRKAGLS